MDAWLPNASINGRIVIIGRRAVIILLRNDWDYNMKRYYNSLHYTAILFARYVVVRRAHAMAEVMFFASFVTARLSFKDLSFFAILIQSKNRQTKVFPA